MNVLLEIVMKDKNDTLTKMLRKTLLDDEKVKELGRTDVAVALGKRVLELQEENAKRHRGAAQEEFLLFHNVADAKVAKAQVEFSRQARHQLERVERRIPVAKKSQWHPPARRRTEPLK